jgi:DNA-binding MarR family transcriptional regulator
MNAPSPVMAQDEPIELGSLGQSIGFMLRLAQTRAYDQFFTEFAETEVRPGEFSVLWVVSLNPGIKQGPLARALNIKPAHMTKLVDRLVRADQMRRDIPAEDRRSVRLTLTDAGQAHVDLHRDRFHAVHRSERIGLSDAEVGQLLALLAKLNFQEDAPCL